MKFLLTTLFSLLVLASIGAYLGVFIVDETQFAFRLQFGSPVGSIIRRPGVHLSIPFIQTIKRYDNRVLDFDGDADLIPTKDKKYIYVDPIARWRITDPLAFYQKLGTFKRAQQILDGIIDAAVSGIVSRNNLIESVRSSNKIVTKADDKTESDRTEAQIRPITKGRKKLEREILKEASRKLPQYGIQLIDVRFKKIALEEKVQKKVLQRMISERDKIATRIRSEGIAKRDDIIGTASRDIVKMLAEAKMKAQIIMGEGDSQSAQTYANAYIQDADFFKFYRQLQSYEQTITKQTTLMMSITDPYFRLFSGYGVVTKSSRRKKAAAKRLNSK